MDICGDFESMNDYIFGLQKNLEKLVDLENSLLNDLLDGSVTLIDTYDKIMGAA
jgi:hypothetical protein